MEPERGPTELKFALEGLLFRRRKLTVKGSNHPMRDGSLSDRCIMIVVRVSQDVELGREWSCHANLAAGWIKAEI